MGPALLIILCFITLYIILIRLRAAGEASQAQAFRPQAVQISSLSGTRKTLSRRSTKTAFSERRMEELRKVS